MSEGERSLVWEVEITDESPTYVTRDHEADMADLHRRLIWKYGANRVKRGLGVDDHEIFLEFGSRGDAEAANSSVEELLEECGHPICRIRAFSTG